MALQRWAILAICLVSALMNRPVRGDEPTPAPISVLAQVPAKPYYVGQAIELRVGATAAGERPEVVAPEIPNTEIALIGTDLSPVTASGIGNLTSERNLFVTKYRLIARRAGVLRIPPVRVRLGARSGASRPLEIDVQSLPLVGRPAAFLGGVGVFAVAAEVSPNTVRAGQELTYTIHVTGPAARGMTGAPSLTRFAELSLGLQVEPLAAVVVNSPPSCQFRYRIRPTRAGTASLPPVAVAAFDPQTAHYVTRVTSSIAIHVVDVPRFDPSTLDYPPPPAPETRRGLTASGVRLAASLSLGIVAAVVAGLVARHVRNRWRADSRRWLLRRARGLDSRPPATRTAREITAILAVYLERTTGRPPGVLTPDEARSGIAQATQDAGLGARSARLVEDCDRACYADGEREAGSAELVALARRLFREIVEKRKRRGPEEGLGEGSLETRERQA